MHIYLGTTSAHAGWGEEGMTGERWVLLFVFSLADPIKANMIHYPHTQHTYIHTLRLSLQTIPMRRRRGR